MTSLNWGTVFIIVRAHLILVYQAYKEHDIVQLEKSVHYPNKH